MKTFAGITLLATLMTGAVWANDSDGHVDVTVGPLTPRAAAGQLIFNQNCGLCHGMNGQGTLAGPPLIHSIYNPGHHDNGSFSRAVTKGVVQHHWTYGNMPPQPQIGFAGLTGILAFIREVQVQNGILAQQHSM